MKDLNSRASFRSTDIHDQAEVRDKLWREIERHQIGMLGLVGGEPQHFQPMTAFAEAEDGKV